MKPAAGIFLLGTVALAQTATAPPDRTPYRGAYAQWRTTDPDLERDAASRGPALGARADKLAAQAAHFYALKKAYLEALQADAGQNAAALEAQPAPPEFDANPGKYVAAQTGALTASINGLASDPDRLIQRLRQALERERTALAALASGLVDTQKGNDAVEKTSAAAEQSRAKMIQHYQALSASLQQTAQQTGKVSTLWADYYRTLSDGVRGMPPPEPALISSMAPVSAPPSAPAAIPAVVPARAPAAMPTAAPAPAPASIPVPPASRAPAPAPELAALPRENTPPVLRTRSITPLPLSRYMGAWVYPTQGAEFHGIEPDVVDLTVREENGQAKGTILVHFKLPQGNRTDPIVLFDFEGPLQATRNQSFPLVTGHGAKGSVELIPGPAFNLLEVNFTTEDKPGTVRQGNFLLIKK
jgi:hypothetical protein